MARRFFISLYQLVPILVEFNVWNAVSGQDDFQQVDENDCLFPDSIQGAYRTQDSDQPKAQPGSFIRDFYDLRDPIKYMDVYIGPSAIPYWGDCEEKYDVAYVLKQKKVGGRVCYRCLVIIQRTPNVLQVRTASQNECYGSAPEARQTCVDPNKVQPYEGMILYRSEHIQYQYCPVGGQAMLMYTVSGGRLHCPYPSNDPSTISNCKYGYQLDIALRGCTFPPYDISFRCLGTWDAGKGNGEKYFAIYNVASDEYRCGDLGFRVVSHATHCHPNGDQDDSVSFLQGIVKVSVDLTNDFNTWRITEMMYNEVKQADVYAVAALTNDSTCSSSLTDSANGYEYFAFYRDPNLSNTTGNKPILRDGESCDFPSQIQGDWETMNIDHDSINFYEANDPSTMNTIYGMCTESKGEKLRITTQSHCGGTATTTCMWWKVRGAAMMEVKLVHLSSPADQSTCFYDTTYQNTSWSIVPARAPTRLAACPFNGNLSMVAEYQRKGRYCYNITTDCVRPSRFRLIKYLCDTTDIFDDSAYDCLASWLEEDNTRYTLVNRSNDGTKGCMASQTDNKGRIFVNRMTKQCQRRLDFTRLLGFGRFEGTAIAMEQTASCPQMSSASFPFDYTGPPPGSTRPSWTGSNRHKNGTGKCVTPEIAFAFSSVLILFYVLS